MLELLHINQLRLKQALLQNLTEHGPIQEQTDPSGLSREAGALIKRLLAFDPAEHAKSQHQAAWTRLGYIFKSALILFASSSLQASYRTTINIESVIRSTANWLASEIETVVRTPMRERTLFWPLFWPTIALGVYAAVEAPVHRHVVRQCLLQLSWDLGVAQPLLAKELLETFWLSGSGSWSACFERPYTFMTVC